MLSRSPQVFDSTSTRKIHAILGICLAPLFLVATIHYGLTPVELLLAGSGAAWLTDFLWGKTGGIPRKEDGQAVLWGALLVLCLPPSAPWPLALVGGVFTIFVKRLFGGSTGVWINPILAAWAFCRLSWPAFFSLSPDVVSGPTPLQTFHKAIVEGASGSGAPMTAVSRTVWDQSWTDTLNNHIFSWIHVNLPPGYVDLIAGNLSTALMAGTTLLVLAASVWLLVARVVPWQIPASAVVGLAVPSWIFGGLFLQGGWFSGDVLLQIFGGSFLLGMLFLATESASRPLCRGSWFLYGLLIGITIFLFRFFGLQSDGTGAAILVVGLFVPWIDQLSWRKREF